MAETGRILAGIKVLDVGTFVFGPAAATVMSDFGADVIKVEPPGFGDPYRYLAYVPPLPACEHNYCWLLTGRNKKSVALNLKQDEARDILLRLVKDADVFVTNFPPAVLTRLRLTYDDLAPLNSKLVYAQATGYGEAGAEANKPGYDATAWWARSGLMEIIRAPGADPGLPMPAMGDQASTMALLSGILMALFHRERTGSGSKVSSSLMANGAWVNAVFLQSVLCGAAKHVRRTRKETPNALLNFYRCRDDRWFFLAMVQEDKDWDRFARCLDRPELRADARFADKAARRANARVLIDILDEVFAEKDYAHWRDVLNASSITFGEVARTEDLPDDRQMADNDVFVELDHPKVGKLRTVNSPIWIEGHDKVKPTLAPEIGQHTNEVLASLGFGPDEIQALRESGAVA